MTRMKKKSSFQLNLLKSNDCFSKCNVYIYTILLQMIKSFKSKALRLLWEKNDSSKLPFSQLKRISLALQIIDDLEEVPQDLGNLVSWRPHPLKGDLQGFWSLDITGNYRIIFRFENKNAFDLDYLDTH